MSPHDIHTPSDSHTLPACQLKFPGLSPTLTDHPVLKIYTVIKNTNVPNYLNARIPLKSGLNMCVWKHYLGNSPKHAQLLNYLEFGFPINYVASQPPQTDHVNHSSATKYADHVTAHLKNEIKHQAMLGPFDNTPFSSWFHTSPMMTREKKGTDKRRIISDMSWPLGNSVNSSTPQDTYQGNLTKTKLPTLNDILSKVRQYGKDSYLASLDIARAYSQLRVDPLD
jgi:hypothetical protein